MKDAFVAPKPVNGTVIMVNAASSGAGLDYAAKHSDLIFVTSPAGANLDRACEALPPHNTKIKALARRHEREVKTIINPHVICRATATRSDWVIGGNVHVVGSPAQVVDAFVRLHKAGCDGGRSTSTTTSRTLNSSAPTYCRS